MGRFSSVQAYADNHTGVRKVPYEQASGQHAAAAGGGADPAPKMVGARGVKPEKVVNPYGSTAGAGSGDFHVYRHARNRELQRQKHMELTADEQKAEELFQREQAKNKKWEEERTAKRRKKRDRQKNAKKCKQNLAKAGIILHAGVSTEDQSDEDEFQYSPGEALAPVVMVETTQSDESKPTSTEEERIILDIPNDGSFLEMMKLKLKQPEVEQPKQPPTEAVARENCE